MGKKKAPSFDFTVIPNGSFVVFQTDDPMGLASALGEGSHAADALSARGITGMILTPDEEISALTDADLAHLGLKRVSRKPADRPH